MNILYGAIYLLITFTITLILFKLFGKTGLYIWICISVIISNIQSVKLIEIFGISTVLGNIAYSNVYLSTDILNEKYGKKSANLSVLFGFIMMLAFTCLMSFSLLFIPGKYDFGHDSLVNIFAVVPRICAASLLAYVSSQFLDVFIFAKLKKKFNKLWLSNNVGTLVSQILDTVVFVLVAYMGTMPFTELLLLMVTMYMFKSIIALLDTLFVYIAKKIKQKEVKD